MPAFLLTESNLIQVSGEVSLGPERQAVITQQSGQDWLVEMSSALDVKLNGEKIFAKPLTDGDKISLNDEIIGVYRRGISVEQAQKYLSEDTE